MLPPPQPTNNSILWLKKLGSPPVVQVSYLTWGVLQEKIMTQRYYTVMPSSPLEDGGQRFGDSQFLVFVNRVLAFTLSGLYLLVSQQPRHVAPVYKYSYCSFSNIMSSWCQYEALKFVAFPTQVVLHISPPVLLLVDARVCRCAQALLPGLCRSCGKFVEPAVLCGLQLASANG